MTLQADQDARTFDDAGVVVRRRLLSALDRAARRPITLVAAPTGYGKTTLLRQWAQEHPEALSFDGGRARPWEQVVCALREGRPVLVDDAHLAGWGSAFAAACGAAGPSASLVVASRVDPLVALHPDRLAGRVSEIRAEELAFSLGELSRVVARSGRRLDHAQAEAMHLETDGWPAGVRLTAMRSRDGLATDGAYSPSGSYLMAHVVADLDPRVRAFLLATAVPEEFDVALACRLSGRSDAYDVLGEITHSVGFVVRDGATGRLRYHPMLRHLLLSELEREPVARLHALHQIAGRWTFGRDQLEASAGHAVRAHDDDLAADVAVALACRSLGDDDWSALDALTSAVPAVFARDDERGRLLLTLRAARNDDSVGAAAALARTARRTSLDIPTHERVGTLTALCRGWLALGEGQGAAAQEWIAAADPAVDLGAGSPTAGLRSAWVRVYGALLVTDGRLDEVDAVRRYASRLARHAPCAGATAAEMTMWAAFAAGRPADAHKAAGEVERLSDGSPPRSVSLVRAWLDVERGSPAGVDPPQGQADQLPGMLPSPLLDLLAEHFRHRAVQPPRPAHEVVAECQRATTWLVARHTLLGAVTALLSAGATTTAVDAVQRVGTAHPRLDTSPYLLWIALTDALRTGVREQLGPLLEQVDCAHDVPEDLRVRTLLAAAALAHRGDDATAASARLRPALESTAVHGWRRPWLALGPSAFDLLTAEHGRVGAHGDLVTRLLVELRKDREITDELVVALSTRELEILQYLPTSLDQGELCATLFISRNTLKTHLRAIYRKLGVESRREAVLKAQRVGLL
ncbi:hypothetical protein H4N58_06080 [Mumia sp. ZJ1417]|uniref:LuxR C-terminal-related transcriptional regulator n=1 Tax=Mumia sp. ZJ1417 TaxID=2708082 RepID=UPI0014205FCB|nr:LuxR C-terminal-related transcriptional regulator [Mumia sp. ZJ1417]QMW67468.1 hypothetical protein H4N58_06080 [Mumia sp. ZJ1417]